MFGFTATTTLGLFLHRFSIRFGDLFHNGCSRIICCILSSLLLSGFTGSFLGSRGAATLALGCFDGSLGFGCHERQNWSHFFLWRHLYLFIFFLYIFLCGHGIIFGHLIAVSLGCRLTDAFATSASLFGCIGRLGLCLMVQHLIDKINVFGTINMLDAH